MSRKAMDDVDARDLEAERLWRAEAAEVDADEPTETKRPPAHKDTKRWCKGKVGRAHDPAVQIPANSWRPRCEWVTNIGDRAWYSCAHVELCVACGKVLRRASYWMDEPDARTTLLSEECPLYAPSGQGPAGP